MIKFKSKKKEIKFNTSKFVVNENVKSKNLNKDIIFDISVTQIKNIDNKKIIIISSDIIWFSEKLTNEIEQKINSKFNIPIDNILLSATHTHGSLQTDVEFKFGQFDNKFNNTIVENIIKILSELSELAYNKANISLGADTINKISVNRRLYTYTFKLNEPFKRSQNRPNLNKNITNNLFSLIFKSNEDEILFVIVIFSCHPVTDKEHITGKDYPGIIKKKIDEYYGINNCIFLQGFCGDINPNFIKNNLTFKELLISYIIGPSFRKPTDAEEFSGIENKYKQFFSENPGDGD